MRLTVPDDSIKVTLPWSQAGEAVQGQRKLLEIHNLYSSPNATALELSN